MRNLKSGPPSNTAAMQADANAEAEAETDGADGPRFMEADVECLLSTVYNWGLSYLW